MCNYTISQCPGTRSIKRQIVCWWFIISLEDIENNIYIIQLIKWRSVYNKEIHKRIRILSKFLERINIVKNMITEKIKQIHFKKPVRQFKNLAVIIFACCATHWPAQFILEKSIEYNINLPAPLWSTACDNQGITMQQVLLVLMDKLDRVRIMIFSLLNTVWWTSGVDQNIITNGEKIILRMILP